MALDYAKTARDIVEKAGGEDNITTVAHCMTRLRFTVKNEKAADMDAIKGIKGVLGCVYAGDQLQVIMGQNLIGTYNEVTSQFNFKEGDVIDENLDEVSPKDMPFNERFSPKRLGNLLLGYVSASVTPMIPALIAGGMVKVILLLITQVMPDFANTSTYTLLSIADDAPFYFMPIWVAYGASKKLGATPIYAMTVAAAMIAPNFLNLVNADPQVSQDLFGLPVTLRAYTSQLFPSLLLAYAAAKFEKLFDRIVPGIFKSILVGSLTLALTYTVTMVALAPIGGWMGDYLTAGIMALYNFAGPVALCLLTGVLPFVIMCGMHTTFGAFMTQLLGSVGYDGIFRPALLLHNMAEGGACLGVFLRAKDKEFKSEALSIAVGCIFAGVTEPAIYGITLRLKKPMIGVCIGGAAGGLVGGLMGMRAYVMGYSNVFALPIFQDTIIAAVVAILTAIVVACVVAFVLGFEEDEAKA